MTASFFDETGVKISPSLMCADQADLAGEVARLEAIGADMIHLDIMDAVSYTHLTLPTKA